MSSTPDAPASARAQATRAALLRAARDVFGRRGYADATIAEIVGRSGTSTGSLYNQFGGKAGLFFAVQSDISAQLWDVTVEAMDDLRRSGERDPLTIYLAGARAYLLACWQSRAILSMVKSGDVPETRPGGDHEHLRRWIRQNAEVLQVDSWRLGEAFAAAVTGIVSAAIPQVCRCRTKAAAQELIDYYAELVARLMRPSAP